MTGWRTAYTVVESMILVLVLVILAFVAIPKISESSTTEQSYACMTNIQLLNQKIERFEKVTGSFPGRVDLSEVPGFAAYLHEGFPKCPFGLDYKYDMDLKRVAPHKHHR